MSGIVVALLIVALVIVMTLLRAKRSGALKVTVYSYTPAWVAAVLNLVPALAILGLIAALYGLYLLYLGLPVLMHNPSEKSLPYTVVVVLCAIVIGAVFAALSTCFLGAPAMMGAAHV